jgi:hypothetical protein
MHIEPNAAIALAIVAHACIGRLQGPPPVVNGFAWVLAVLIAVVLLLGVLSR